MIASDHKRWSGKPRPRVRSASQQATLQMPQPGSANQIPVLVTNLLENSNRNHERWESWRV